MQFTLMNDRLFVTMHELDGIFNRKNVVSVRFVDTVDNRRQCRGLAGTRGSRYQDQAIAEIGNFIQLGWQVQIIKAWDRLRNYAHDDRMTASLLKYIHAKTTVSRHAIGDVAGSHRLQCVGCLVVRSNQFESDTTRVLWTQWCHA